MNSEELEQSLRTEFEDYLKRVFADVQQEISALQEKIESEFERHKTEFARAFEDFGSRAVGSDNELDAGFRASVVEHLRLARDEGARITATAIAEAEAMEKDAAANAPKLAGVSELRDGINDISAQTSQASILKSLVSAAEQFTPRGAFFIVKNEHLVGWRVFGSEEQRADGDQAVREIFFPVSDKTALGASVQSLSAVESSYGEYADNSVYLNKLGFGEPEKIIAVPLVARGRGVAVLYADQGENGKDVNVEALETLVRVAGLTVEILAAGGSVSAPAAAKQSADFQPQREEKQSSEDSQSVEAAPEASFDYAAPAEASYAADYTAESAGSDYSRETNYQPESVGYDSAAYSTEESEADAQETTVEAEEYQPAYQPGQTEGFSWNQPAAAEEAEVETEGYSDDAASTNQYQFDQTQSYESPADEFENAPVHNYQPQQYGEAQQDFTAPAASENNYASFESQNGGTAVQDYAEEVKETPKPARSRFSDRNIDLPVEVSEDERRLHNDARRFARLLVSEIKLYNEQKVKEGRDENDLYERLREAIDRSREMYDKRVQPPVAAKFDYFHYELVNSLAEGDEAKLGESYVGATV